MKLTTFLKAQGIRSEIDCLQTQIDLIEKPNCEVPIKMNYVHNEEIVENIKKSAIREINKRIKVLEKEFENLK